MSIPEAIFRCVVAICICVVVYKLIDTTSNH